MAKITTIVTKQSHKTPIFATHSLCSFYSIYDQDFITISDLWITSKKTESE
jgi:hypothetical protein